MQHLTIGALKPLRTNTPAATAAAHAAVAVAAGTTAAAAAAGAGSTAVDEGPVTVCDSKLQKLRQVRRAARGSANVLLAVVIVGCSLAFLPVPLQR
jgi:hypothetical protein